MLGTGSSPPLGWSLDNVYIGGTEINPSSLYETFQGGLDETRWEFYPNGQLWDSHCGRESSSMAWGTHVGQQSITTGQIIVQHHYMIQFKVGV